MIVTARQRRWPMALLLAVAVAAVAGVFAVPPIRQDLAYHALADQRRLIGVPHALNVLSNVGFVIAGVWAFGRVTRAGVDPWERVAGHIFALGLVLTGLGSAWYHLAPGNDTLVWDRLPLSTLFPVVFAVAIGDRVSMTAGRVLLAPLVLGAIASVFWWQQTDDLRAYVLAQFLPMVLIPLMLLLRPGRRTLAPLVTGIALYAAAKLAELGDHAVFALGGLVSGHTLKHLMSAVAAAFIVLWLAPQRGWRGAGGPGQAA
jgi:hypothetical protein